jgi:signal recognition particle receptor subunit beta
MAVVDLKNHAVVIRIVYDGPPFAGKTTSVQALGRSLGRKVESPSEFDGRTLLFDWLEYTGGLFEGQRIRCQIVSVPGQPDLAPRRRALLETADVVVFVADSGDRKSLEQSATYIRELTALLRTMPGPPVGVIVQANKRDLPEAVPRSELRELLGGDAVHVGLTESVADSGAGVRETFVLAVRVALDRVRALLQAEALSPLDPTTDGAAHLLGEIEKVPLSAAPSAGGAQALGEEEPPKLPDTRVPTGAIWPPVEGRLVLHEAVSRELVPHRIGGDWVAGVGSEWKVHSQSGDVFRDFDEGRRALIGWAREHAALSEILSPMRCVVLAEASEQTWRLWQVVRTVATLRSWLLEGAGLEVRPLYRRLVETAAALGEAYARFSGTRLQPTLDTVGICEGGVHYVALMPQLRVAPLASPDDIEDKVARQLSKILSSELEPRRAALAANTVVSMWKSGSPWDAVVTAAIVRSG